MKLVTTSRTIAILDGFFITIATDLAVGLPHDFSVHIDPRSTLLSNFVKIGPVEAEIQRYLH